MRVAKPPDDEDDVDVLRTPPVPMEPTLPKRLPRTPEPLPMNEVNKLIYYSITFYLRSSKRRTTAPPAHTAGDCMRSFNEVDDVPPPDT